MDTYQAVYDAVRSKFSSFNSHDLIDAISRKFDISHEIGIIKMEFISAAYEMQRPSVIFKPALSIDGNSWCALYGDNLQTGVAGFGDSPNKAMLEFDKEWATSITKASA